VIAVDVADRGPGVPEESLDLLFRAFNRTDTARRDTTGGFGVGLSIAERAIQLHGSSIFARNRDGGGLIVSIRLPQHRTEIDNN
jgi:two-component system, OmpR family, sensor histidine kinase CpxA